MTKKKKSSNAFDGLCVIKVVTDFHTAPRRSGVRGVAVLYVRLRRVGLVAPQQLCRM